jgi:hypothetical protein
VDDIRNSLLESNDAKAGRKAAMSTNVDTETFAKFERLKQLRVQHRELDELIERLAADLGVDQLYLRRLKKRKLQLKDTIAKLESDLIPDLHA